jgi:prepilin-type N-terminal cleavage/methylation domain-containing protein
VSRERCAFTLVELLVTLAVLTVLIALSVGPLRSVRDSGRQIQCVNNLRSLHAAVELYRNDHKNLYPYADSIATFHPSRVLAPYDVLAATLQLTLPDAGPVPIHGPQPLWCPADHLASNPSGISYIYMPWELMAAWPGTNVQRSVTLALERSAEGATPGCSCVPHLLRSEVAVLSKYAK